MNNDNVKAATLSFSFVKVANSFIYFEKGFDCPEKQKISYKRYLTFDKMCVLINLNRCVFKELSNFLLAMYQ